ncbi:MAG: SpoIID/LytB domain-containing protein, partial [Oscillospiraceae bacterium]|nr:SpoIID/LytB domain-containing protein [Oscillospiraceae bacterium]
GENRVACSPETVGKFVKDGYTVLVENHAGDGALYHDEEYAAAPKPEQVEHVRLDLYQMDPTVGNGTISVPYTYYDFLTPDDIYDPAPEVTAAPLTETKVTTVTTKAEKTEEPAETTVTTVSAENDKDTEETTTFIEAKDINPIAETEAETEPAPRQAGYLIPSRYTGQEIFTAKFDGATQEIDAYTLVCMICATEMSPSFSQEALKAQAVAAYSYVKYHNVNGLTPSVLVKHEVHDATIAAVDAVFGQCVYYNGKVAQTVYTASTAGSTASGKNVWGGGAPYLESVSTPIDELYDPNWGIKVTYTEDEMRSKIQNYCGITLSEDPSQWIKIDSYYDGRYVDNIIIDGQMSIKGQRFRDGLMHYGLKSWAFDVEYADGVFTFTTYGYGHGVGLSQNGANILGRQGYTYDEILKYYFPGITIE